MEFTEQQITDLSLSEDQVKGVNKLVSENWDVKLAEAKETYNGKANNDFQNIFDGATRATHEKTGFTLSRDKGEKAADYWLRYGNAYAANKLESERTEVDGLKTDYETKLKDFKGDENLKSEYDALKITHDENLKKYANFDSLKDQAGKYETVSQEMTVLTKQLAYSDAKPVFPDTVNKYEAEAKFDAVIKNIEQKYEIKYADGKGIALDKENEYTIKNLKDLVAQDETIKELLKGRQQGGPGADPVERGKIEGVPFEVPKEAVKDAKLRSEAIGQYLAKQNLDSKEYAKQFAELNIKIRSGQIAA